MIPISSNLSLIIAWAAIVLLGCLFILYISSLAVMVLTNAHLVHIRYFDKTEDGLNCIQAPHKVDKERTDSIWLDFSGTGKSSHIGKGGFVFEYCNGPEKINMMYTGFREFKHVVNMRKESISEDYESCWKCGGGAARRNSMKGAHSRIIRLGVLDYTITYDEPAYVCQECQNELYRSLVKDTEIVPEDELIAREI